MTGVDLLVPGDISQLTGGYIYDRRIFTGLERLGWDVSVHSLPDTFPEPDASTLEAADAVLSRIADGRTVVVDGLAFAGLRKLIPAHTQRLDVVALIHHPLAFETGTDAATAERLLAAERAALALVDSVIVTSEWTKRALAGFGVDASRVVVVKPGTDPAPLRSPIPGAPTELLCVASLTPRKGHAVLFDALGRLRDRHWHLTCAGSLARDAPLVESLLAQIERLGLRERVALVGEIEPPALGDYYARADVFVLASYMEGYGMAFAEALARGIPIVATTGGAVAATVPAAASRLVPPGDAGLLAAALTELLDDERLRVRLGEAAAAVRARLPTWDEAAREFARALARA